MPKKIFTAPAPGLADLADEIQHNYPTAILGGADPENEDGVIVWIEVDEPEEAAEFISMAAKAWDDHAD
jgi:hypothetical protein